MRTLPPKKLTGYPNLKPHNHRVTSEETIHKKVRYNCVAWAAIGDTKKWWQAGVGPDFYWPNGILSDDSLDSYIEMFGVLGYRKCDNSRLEIAFEKNRDIC